MAAALRSRSLNKAYGCHATAMHQVQFTMQPANRKQSIVVSWLEATIGSFCLSNNSFISPKKKKSLKMKTDTATRGVRDWNNLRMLHTNTRNVEKWLFGERTLWEPTSSLSQVRFHLTFMNIRRAVCLVTINGYIMSQNKRAFLWREEPTRGEKSTSSGTERAGLWMPIWRRKDGGNATHTPLRHSMTSDFIH